MEAIHATPVQTTDTKSGDTPEVTAPNHRQTPQPGRIVSFEEALNITLREDKELLHRLAQ